jgi:hypothetical protein
MESVQWRAFFATSELDYPETHLYLIDDVAKKRIERNRTPEGELWCLFVVGGAQHSTRVPLAESYHTLGSLEERGTGARAPQMIP